MANAADPLPARARALERPSSSLLARPWPIPLPLPQVCVFKAGMRGSDSEGGGINPVLSKDAGSFLAAELFESEKRHVGRKLGSDRSAGHVLADLGAIAPQVPLATEFP